MPKIKTGPCFLNNDGKNQVDFLKPSCLNSRQSPFAITKSTGAVIPAAPAKSRLPDEFIKAVMLIRDKYGKDVPACLAKIMSQRKLIFDNKFPEFIMALFELYWIIIYLTIKFNMEK